MTLERKSLTFIEIDLDRCSLTYGIAPCTASIPTTGDNKCFNSLGTCQDRANFTNGGLTVRFGLEGLNYYPTEDFDYIPSLVSVNFTPSTVSLGVDLGQRATLECVFKDHRSNDFDGGIVWDKYSADRAYNSFEQGTFWGKFRARNPFLRGRAIRWITGYVGQLYNEMEIRHFIIESFDGPTPDGKYTIYGKDIFKLADGDRAQAPVLSQGFLNAGITNVATAATLSPSGIGNAEYPASGAVAIGGKEICTFTRIADALTLTRAQFNTTGVAHDAQEKVQLCLVYTGVKVSDIIRDLFITYADIDTSFINQTAWNLEDTTYLGNLYTAIITNPTGVNELVSELVKQAALVLWWDDINEKIGFQVLHGIVASPRVFNSDIFMENSFAVKEQPEKRISQVWTFFGQINALTSLDDEANYRSVAVTVDLQSETDYGTPAIDKIFSRWIPTGGRSIALRLNDIQIGRFRDPPRQFNFDCMKYNDNGVVLVGGYTVEHWSLQDALGASVDVPIQITRLNPTAAITRIEGEEVSFVVPTIDLTNRQITIDSNINNFNLRTAHDAIYPTPQSGDVVTCTIESGVIVGSNGPGNVAYDVGSWPSGVTLNLVLIGRIQGAAGFGGGAGGGGGGLLYAGNPGGSAGTAFYTRYAITLSSTGQILGGGGGGGGGAGFGGGGGGGRGQQPGLGGIAATGGGPGTNATTESPGPGGAGSGVFGAPGGAGGDAGQNGLNGFNTGSSPGGNGGTGGNAIDGNSFITGGGSLTVTGARIN